MLLSHVKNAPDRLELWLVVALLVVSLFAGAFLRFGSHAIPWTLAKYGGSFFWALSIYWLLLLSPLRRPWLAAAFLTSAIELFKLVHLPWLDGFRHTLAGILLLGRIFSLRNLAVYGLAILCGFFCTRLLCVRLPSRNQSQELVILCKTK